MLAAAVMYSYCGLANAQLVESFLATGPVVSRRIAVRSSRTRYDIIRALRCAQGLKARTPYVFNVVVRDESGRTGIYAPNSFKPLSPDDFTPCARHSICSD